MSWVLAAFLAVLGVAWAWLARFAAVPCRHGWGFQAFPLTMAVASGVLAVLAVVRGWG